MEAVVDRALASRPVSLRRKLVFFVHLLGWLSAARYGRRLTSLDAHRRRSFLAAVERSRLLAGLPAARGGGLEVVFEGLRIGDLTLYGTTLLVAPKLGPRRG